MTSPETKRKVATVLWLSSVSLALIVLIGHYEQKSADAIEPVDKPCVMNEPCPGAYKVHPGLYPTQTPQPQYPEVQEPQVLATAEVQPQNEQMQAQQVQPQEGQSISQILKAKNIGDQFVVVDIWENKYLVEKTTNKFIVIAEMERKTPKITKVIFIPERYIKSVE